MTTHDPYCRWPGLPCSCADLAAARDEARTDERERNDEHPRRLYVFDPDYLDEHDEAIRADEREQWEQCSREVHRLNSELDAAREALTSLRAKVEELPIHEFDEVSTHSGYRAIVTREGLCRTDVIALIGKVAAK